MSQTLDITRLTASPTRQPNVTSATLDSLCPIPIDVDPDVIPAVMITAAVIGA